MDRASRNGQITQSEVIDIMRCTRLIIEASDAADRYPVTHLFCNWLVHTKLEGPIVVYPILSRATKALRRHLNEAEGMNYSMSEILDLIELRRELMKIHEPDSSVYQLFDSFQNWKVFSNAILEDLIEKPIELPVGAEKAPTTRHGRIFVKLVEEHGEGPFARSFYMKDETREGVSGIFWAIRLASHGGIDTGEHHAELNGGPLALIEDPKAFGSP